MQGLRHAHDLHQRGEDRGFQSSRVHSCPPMRRFSIRRAKPLQHRNVVPKDAQRCRLRDLICRTIPKGDTVHLDDAETEAQGGRAIRAPRDGEVRRKAQQAPA